MQNELGIDYYIFAVRGRIVESLRRRALRYASLDVSTIEESSRRDSKIDADVVDGSSAKKLLSSSTLEVTRAIKSFMVFNSSAARC